MAEHMQEDSPLSGSNDSQRDSDNPSSAFSYSYGYSFFDPCSGYVMNYFGPFTGVGASGLQRSDKTIAEDVFERLAENGHFDATGIEVRFANGRVLLKGTVEDRCAEQIALDIVHTVPGVASVRNELVIKRRVQPAAAR
ncbi:MAG: BON domain-containing protein [Rudaea sp.]